MLLKNWKSHSLQMHSMSQAAIDMKYIELRREVEQSKSEIMNLAATTNTERPGPSSTNTLFSMKRFALAKSASLNVPISDVSTELNQTQSIQSHSQDIVLNSTTSDHEPASTSPCAQMDTNESCTLH